MPIPSPNTDDVLTPRPDLRSLSLPDGGLSIYVAQSAEAYVLNSSAAQVWGQLDGTATLGEVIERLQGAHGADAGLASDVLRIATEMTVAALVLRASDDGT